MGAPHFWDSIGGLGFMKVPLLPMGFMPLLSISGLGFMKIPLLPVGFMHLLN